MSLFSSKKLSEKQFELRLEKLRVKVRREVGAFEDMSDEARKERHERGRADKLYFFKTYLPHYFYTDFADFHEEMADFSDIKGEVVCLALPREHAKSTFFSFGDYIHGVAYELFHFGLIVSDTEDLASDFTAFIMIELEENVRLKQDFGELMPSGKQEAADFTTKNGIRIKARGQGQRVRGLRNRQYRPDKVTVDDYETEKSVKNPRIVKEKIDWLLQTVLGSLADNYQFVFIGNLLSPKSVLKWFIDETDEQGNPRYVSKVYKAYQDDGTPLWPALWPIERLEKRKRQMGPVRFNGEMMNDPKDADGLFQREWLANYYEPADLAGQELVTAEYADPSSESKGTNDFKAIVVVSVSERGVYVRHAWIKRATPSGLVHALYDLKEEYAPEVIAAEDNAIGEFLQSALNLTAQERGYQLALTAMKHSTNKVARVGRISALAERRKIFFIKDHSDQNLLREQLEAFPSSSVNDDGPDALEGAIALAEGRARKAASGSVDPESTRSTGGIIRRTMGRLGIRRRDDEAA